MPAALPPSFPVPWLGPVTRCEEPVEVVDGHMVPGDADERQPLAQEPPDEGDPRLEVVGPGEGLFVLGGGPAEPVDDLLDGDERDVPFLGREEEEPQAVLAHPLLDQPGHLCLGDGERGDGHRLLEDPLQGVDVVPGNGLVVVPEASPAIRRRTPG